MTREEAIKRFEYKLKAAIAVLDSGFGTHPGENDRLYRERKEMAQLALAALREQEERRWIPVTERLPDPFERVIVCRDDGKVEQGCKDVRDWWKVYGTRTKQVTHWMPLPEPPRRCEYDERRSDLVSNTDCRKCKS